jgi:putative heme-binding domain-containing protein
VTRLDRIAAVCCLASLVAGGVASSLSADDAKPFGIDRRVPWTMSMFAGTPDPPSPYLTERVFPLLQFQNPIEMLAVPGSNRLLVAELNGKVWTFQNQNDAADRELAIDIGSQLSDTTPATRLYGVAFHPQFEQNGECFLCYITAANVEDGTRVSRFKTTSLNPLRIDSGSEEVLITWRSGGHNGGSLMFGPRDGYLYISTGDASPPFPPDVLKTGQDISDLLASTLRIDVDRKSASLPYAIPDDNPFVGVADARGEVWTYGHRNPWRMSFDRVTGDLWLGDVGWEMWEMIYRAERGANYGWSIVEHTQQVNPQWPRGPSPIIPPTAAHSHTESRSVTGGYVYRGSRLPKLAGTYLYGDYVTGKLWGLRVDGDRLSEPQELVDSSLAVICFGRDHSDEVFVVSYDGTIHRLVENPKAGQQSTFPRRLSDSGLFFSAADHRLAPGVLPFAVNAEPWADSTTATRFIAVPNGEMIGVHTTNNAQVGDLKGEWAFPDGTILGKTISLPTVSDSGAERQQRLETQILHRNGDYWAAYSYIWNDSQTDAELSDGAGFDRTLTVADASAANGQRSQTWHFASRTECILCHTSRGGTVYGFKLEQLNRDFNYGPHSDNQLRTLAHLGLFSEPLAIGADPQVAPLEKLPRMVDPTDESASLDDRVRSYLHVNCSHCHRRGGGGTAALEVLREIAFEKTNLVSRPTQGAFGIVDPWLVAPGDPNRSILFYRMAKLGRGRMPHFGSLQIDEAGLKLVWDWISSLDAAVISETEMNPDTVAAIERLSQTINADLAELASGSKVSDQHQLSVVDRLLSSTSGSIALASALRGEGASLSVAAREIAISRGAAHPDTIVRDLFEPFVPEETRTQRLGTVVDVSQILTIRGDSARGRELFLQSDGLQCRNCHRVNQRGRSVGPDLDGIGKRYSSSELLTSVLAPSQKIEPRYQTWLAETSQGLVHSGLLVEESAEEVVIRDASGRDVRLKRENLELLIAQPKSLMPELQLRDATPQDAADLIAFLKSLQ